MKKKISPCSAVSLLSNRLATVCSYAMRGWNERTKEETPGLR